MEKKVFGEVKIAADVVAAIAALAAAEVDGFSSMVGSITNEWTSKLGIRNLSRGVKVAMDETSVRVDMAVNVKYGYSIPKISEQIQERASFQIEMMTGLDVTEVNVRVAGVQPNN